MIGGTMKAKLSHANDDQAVVVYYSKGDGMDIAMSISVDELPEQADADGVFELDMEILNSGTVYGIQIPELAEMVGTPKLLALLRKQNIWTITELRERLEFAQRLASAHVSKQLRLYVEDNL